MSSQVETGGRPVLPSRLPGGRPSSLPWALRTYRAAMSLARPALWLLLRTRAGRGKEDPARRFERYGIAGAARPAGDVLWLHAASVGETNAVLPLIERLLDARHDLHVLLTTGTVTSAGIAAQRLPPRALHQYLPLEFRALRAAIPRSLAADGRRADRAGDLAQSHHRGPRARRSASPSSTPACRRAVSCAGRASPKSPAPCSVSSTRCSPRTTSLARALAALGAVNVSAVGNIKIDAPLLPVDAAATAIARAGPRRSAPLPRRQHASRARRVIIAAAHTIVRRTLARRLYDHRAAPSPSRAGNRRRARSARPYGRHALARRGAGPRGRHLSGRHDRGTRHALFRHPHRLHRRLTRRQGRPERYRGRAARCQRLGRAVAIELHRHLRPLLAAGGAIEVRSAEDIARQVLAWHEAPASRDAAAVTAKAVLDRLSGGLDRTTEAIISLLGGSVSAGADASARLRAAGSHRRSRQFLQKNTPRRRMCGRLHTTLSGNSYFPTILTTADGAPRRTWLRCERRL